MKDGLVVAVPAKIQGEARAARKWLLRLGLSILVAALLYYSLRNADPSGIWNALRSLQPWQLLAIIGLDVGIFALIGTRWWLLVHAANRDVGLWRLISVRLSAFGVSYFTLGPQIGGEPLQVIFLRRQYGLSLSRAVATVALDKLIELLGNYLFLILGLGALIQTGLLRAASHTLTIALIAVVILAAWPALHIALLRRNVLPVSAALRLLPRLRDAENPFRRQVRLSERLAARFCQRNPRLLVVVLGASLLASLLAVIEYALVTSFLHILLTPWQAIAAWTAAWLSFLMPVPGGLGALEASQVLALGALGATAEGAMGVALVIRGRDILMGGLGLLLGLRRWQPHKSKAA